MSAYAYLCDPCGHLVAGHRLRPGGDLVAGPYKCRLCPCEVSQQSPVTELSKRQYDALPGEVKKAASA